MTTGDYRYVDRVLAVVPAPSEAHGIPHLHIRGLGGKPLMASAIEQARACPLVDRVIVVTDHRRYAEVARSFRADVPFLLPAELAGGEATDLDRFRCALLWLAEHEGRVPEVVVHVRPSYPERTRYQIEDAIVLLGAHPEWDSVRSVAPAPVSPYRMWFARPDGSLDPVVPDGSLMRAQGASPTPPTPAYIENGCVDAVRARTILEMHSMTGSRVGAFVVDGNRQIESMDDLRSVAVAQRFGGRIPNDLTFCIDIDGVIATSVPDDNYGSARPVRERIAVINRLYDLGNHIVVFTGRGSATGLNWQETTRAQLQDWGLKYHELRFGKPAADYHVDGRGLGVDELDMLGADGDGVDAGYRRVDRLGGRKTG